MKFKSRNLRAIANMVIGDSDHFPYRSSFYITQFFEECDLEFVHDGSTRAIWTSERLLELLEDPQPAAFHLPARFLIVLRSLLDQREAEDNDPGRQLALASLNQPLMREGFEAYFDEDRILQARHIGSKTVSAATNPHRPLTPKEAERKKLLNSYLDRCSEDELIEEILLPLFRQQGFHRISAAGHSDKALEYGKDVWMRFVLPTQHVLYFGIQAKKGKLDSAGATKGSNANVAEIYNQVLMMLGHEIFDPETNKKALVDHAFIIAGGTITKQAKNWLGGKLDASKRSQILFMDRYDIMDLYVTMNVPLPHGALPKAATDDDEIPF
ncbi:MAG: hypothetical protein ABJN52_14730 [Litorimonas sp.]|jgi:hypothetical protein